MDSGLSCDYSGAARPLASGQSSEELQASFEPMQLSLVPEKALQVAAAAAAAAAARVVTPSITT